IPQRLEITQTLHPHRPRPQLTPNGFVAPPGHTRALIAVASISRLERLASMRLWPRSAVDEPGGAVCTPREPQPLGALDMEGYPCRWRFQTGKRRRAGMPLRPRSA